MVSKRFGRRRGEPGPAPGSDGRTGALPSIPGYTELTVIGRGASATVYSATQEAFGRTVALKLLHVDVSDRRAQRRFEREKAINGRLSNHPNVVTVLEAGFVDHRYPYLAMEFFEHGSLSQRLAAGGPFSVPQALHAGIRIAGALHSAHSMGILHRDVKPQNILLSRFGEPALADFGIATILELEHSMTAGLTPVHAAPEILEGSEPSPASDVYALASTVYTLLSGAPPFAGPVGEGVLAQLIRITTMDLPKLVRADVPPELFDVLRRATAKQPGDRIADAATFGRELQTVQSKLGVAVTTLPLDAPEIDTHRAAIRSMIEAEGSPVTAVGETAPSSPAPSPPTPSSQPPSPLSPPSLPPPPRPDPPPRSDAPTPSAPLRPVPLAVDDPTLDGDHATTMGARQVQALVAGPRRPRRWIYSVVATVLAVVAGAAVAYVVTSEPDIDAEIAAGVGVADETQPTETQPTEPQEIEAQPTEPQATETGLASTEPASETTEPSPPTSAGVEPDDTTNLSDEDVERYAATNLSWTVVNGQVVLTWRNHAPATADVFVEISWADGRRPVQHIVREGQQTYVLGSEVRPTDAACFLVRAYFGFADDGDQVIAESEPVCTNTATVSTGSEA